MLPRDDSSNDIMMPPIAPRAQVPAAYSPSEIDDPSRGPLRLLWRRRWSVLSVLVLCLLGAWVYLKKTPLNYIAEARVYVQEKGGLIAADQPGMVNNNDSYLYLQGERIKSSEILKYVADAPAIAKLAPFVGQKDPVRIIRSNLAVEVDNHLSIIDLKYSSTDPQVAVLVVNQVLEEFFQSHVDPNKLGGNQVLKVLKQQQLAQDANLLNAQKELKDFRSNHGEISFEGQKGNIVLETLDSVSAALTAARLKEIKSRTDYESALAMQLSGQLWSLIMASPQTNDPNVQALSGINALLQTDQFRLQSMRSGSVLSENPVVKGLQNDIQQLTMRRDALNAVIQSDYMLGLKTQFDNASKEVTGLTAAVTEQQVLAFKLNSLQTDYQMLAMNVQREQTLADTINKTIRGTTLNESAASLNITPLQYGDLQMLDHEPRPNKVLAMAGVMGITLGMVCAFLQDMLDRRIRSADEVRARLRKRVLGAIPHVRGSHSLAGLGRQVDLDPASDASEAFRIVSTSIHLGMPSRRLRAILVTSPHQGDGKTIIASNLAIAMAKTGRRTLLLDADMRNPTTHRIYSVDNRIGLSSILSGEAQPSQGVQASGIECLDVLTAGPIPHNPSELLNNRNFRKLLKDLSEDYDSVVIDVPPVGRFADALIVGAVCKATVLVMRAGKCTLKDGEESLEHLTAAGAAVLGVVVNDLSPRFRRYSSYAAHYARRLRGTPPPRPISSRPLQLNVAPGAGGTQVLVAPQLSVHAEDENGNGNGNGHADENGNGASNGNGEH